MKGPGLRITTECPTWTGREPSGSGLRATFRACSATSASPGAHGIRAATDAAPPADERDGPAHARRCRGADARPDAWSRSRAGACPIPLRPVGRDRAQRGQEDRGSDPGRAGLPGPDPVARGRDRPPGRPPAPSRSDRDREREPHRRRAPDGAGIRDRLQVDRHAAEPGTGDAIAGDAHPGAVDGGPVPLLPQPDDPGHHPGLPGHGDRRADDRWHPLGPLPGRARCCSTSSASRRGSWPSGSARRISPTSGRHRSSSRGFAVVETIGTGMPRAGLRGSATGPSGSARTRYP